MGLAIIFSQGLILESFFEYLNCQIKLDILRNSEKLDIVFDNLKIF